MKKRVLVWLLATMLLPLPVTGAGPEECAVCRDLEEAGFPAGYREALCALQVAHPQWEMIPLFVTALSREMGEDYTFDRVVEEEIREPRRNLIFDSPSFLPYAVTEGERFDAGLFSAKEEAVAFFMDPRNFLGEESIFQFLSLRGGREEGELSVVLPEEISRELLKELGKEYGISPYFLAVRLRQEQGSAGSRLLSGRAGTILQGWYREGTVSVGEEWVLSPTSGYTSEELLALDGYYNPFHVNASGSGAFRILYTGAVHAREMGWNTVEAGLAGGVEKLSSDYLCRFQETIYLQKWNVDIRSRTPSGGSRNFWGQYMQNAGAAVTEGKNLARQYAEAGLWETKLTFLIPVYEGMPTEPASDPAEGTCALYAADPGAVSPHRPSGLPVDPMESAPEDTPSSARVPEPLTVPFWGVGLFLLFSGMLAFFLWQLIRRFPRFFLRQEDEFF